MVLLTMTPAIVEAVKDVSADKLRTDDATPLLEPAVGKPISHEQIVRLWRMGGEASSLEGLLRGSGVYVPPPAPKPEPTKEYKALMARLRREEEAKSYQRMVNPPPTRSIPQQAYASVNEAQPTDLGDDDVTYEEVHRQVMLIFNFMVSILGVAGTIWVAARWWSLTARVLVTLGGSLVVGVAEVCVYGIYVWRMGDAKGRQEGMVEVREVVGTWVSGKVEDDEKTVLLRNKEDDMQGVRKRVAAGTEKT